MFLLVNGSTHTIQYHRIYATNTATSERDTHTLDPTEKYSEKRKTGQADEEEKKNQLTPATQVGCHIISAM